MALSRLVAARAVSIIAAARQPSLAGLLKRWRFASRGGWRTELASIGAWLAGQVEAFDDVVVCTSVYADRETVLEDPRFRARYGEVVPSSEPT